MERLAPIIQDWLDRPGNNKTLLSEISGVPARRIYNICRGYEVAKKRGAEYRYTHVEFTTADKLLLAMGRELEWQDSLKDIWEADDAPSDF